MNLFDEMAGLFRTIGLTEEQVRVAAIGRCRSEADAREALAGDTAGDLADELFEESRTWQDPHRREPAELQAALPLVTENALRIVRGQKTVPMPWQLPTESATPAAESVVEAVRTALRMTPAEAVAFTTRLQEREARSGGPEHAQRFLTEFAAGLHRNMREVREVAV